MTKYGLTIGTNYTGSPYALAGCLNDAEDWTTFLLADEYVIRKLAATDATRANILESLRELVTRARWGDRIVVTYSGHGTWLPDYNGDEVDGRDEAWCPDDMQTAGLITDDDLAGVFGRARAGVGILVLSDSCFSGTMTRLLELVDGQTGQAVWSGPEPTRVRFLPPGFIRGGLTTAKAERDLPLRRTYTERASLISGSAENDVSYDAWFGSRANGAFTQAAISTYRHGMSLAAWHNAIRDRLPSEDYPQAPMLTAASTYRKYARAL